MAFKVNYNQQRAERDRAKQAKKEEKLRAREEEVMRRKNAGGAEGDSAPETADQPAAATPPETDAKPE